MVGMPYPNPTDPELQERMRFMDAQQHAMQLAPPVVVGAADQSPSSQLSTLSHSTVLASSTSVSQQKGSNLTAGREYYEDLCMKAVNQCVGRVIRHKNDYAAIVLADARWCIGNVGVTQGGSQVPLGPLRKLPEWIQDSLTVCKTFGDAYGRLHRFHRQMLSSPVKG